MICDASREHAERELDGALPIVFAFGEHGGGTHEEIYAELFAVRSFSPAFGRELRAYSSSRLPSERESLPELRLVVFRLRIQEHEVDAMRERAFFLRKKLV